MKTTYNNIPVGFPYEGETIFFVEGKGKDISFDRWRACLYYAPHLAKTAFFETQSSYADFMAEASKHTFELYEDYLNYP